MSTLYTEEFDRWRIQRVSRGGLRKWSDGHSEEWSLTASKNCDLVYVCFQFASYMEWDLDQALRVHESNLSKLGDDGKPIYREDGKVLKGPNYQPPDLSDLV